MISDFKVEKTTTKVAAFGREYSAFKVAISIIIPDNVCQSLNKWGLDDVLRDLVRNMTETLERIK